ncbi:D-alanyl-D-alanine carboxypeptidase [Candidatus Saccharibacteria bacterium CG10_big_fil_rev_8_21_14_0_10_47_8]|nr:MAG: D-alanyl-D-alanine carboxypeptidase [Candidatus Saccharibacteria bacterium CG10_big_fil_rev_8_21_14_0_10_47_8]
MYDVTSKTMRKISAKRFIALLIVLVLVVSVLFYARPLPALQPVSITPNIPTAEPLEIPWPAYGQAAIGSSDFAMLETHGPQTAVPIASITKAITALAVLNKHPITPDQQGETITLTDNDVAIYNDYLGRDGSVARVVAGEQLTQYQALQAMLLPSANNIADTLAIWAFGSLEAYTVFANQMLSQMGLKLSRVADASGFSPQSVSTATELVAIGEAVLSNDVLAEIVKQPEASIPVVGSIQNVNWLLGNDGVVGIKTGNTEEAGGCYLFAANHTVGGQTVKFIGAVLGAPTRNTAINDSRIIIKAVDSGFEVVNLARSGTIVGRYSAPWGSSAAAITSKDVSMLVWKGQKPKTTTKLDTTAATSSGGKAVGSVSIAVGKKTATSPVVLQHSIPGPSWQWRIFR